LIGADLALARIILSVSFASIIGMILTATFKGEEKTILANAPTSSIPQTLTDGGEEVISHRFWVFFLVLVAILLVGASSLIGWAVKIPILAVLIAGVLVIIIFWMPKEDTKSWLLETWSFGRRIVPLLLIGVFASGILKTVIRRNLSLLTWVETD